MPVPSIVLAPMVALALVMTPPLSLAANGRAAAVEPASQPTIESDSPDDADGEPGGDAPGSNVDLQPAVTQIEAPPSGDEAATGGGVAGALVDPNDPNATRAQSDLEGERLDTNIAGVPERLPKLQAAGWWTTFGAVALATTGGILAGVAETRQDRAERLAYSFDLSTGHTTLYGPVADEYEGLLRQGETYQWLGRGFIIAGAVALVAGVTVFAVDATRRRRGESGSASAARRHSAPSRLRLDSGAGGLRLRF